MPYNSKTNEQENVRKLDSHGQELFNVHAHSLGGSNQADSEGEGHHGYIGEAERIQEDLAFEMRHD
jgi:hypothetical protein